MTLVIPDVEHLQEVISVLQENFNDSLNDNAVLQLENAALKESNKRLVQV